MRVLILRPTPGSAATADAARTIGLDPVMLPLFAITPLDWTPPDLSGFDGVAMTSANAARHAGRALERYSHLRLYAVGSATAAAARAHGFVDVVTGYGNAATLSALIPDTGRILHLAGAESAGVPHGRIETVAVYQASPRKLGAGAIEAIRSSPVVLVHSPRAGARLAELCPARGHQSIIAISPAAADACGTGWARIAIADRPRDDAMLALARGLCEARLVVDDEESR